MISTFRARRRLHMLPGVYRAIDELVPEAVLWFRVEIQLHTGQLVRTEVTAAEFAAAVDEFCPELREEIYERLDFTPPVPVSLVKPTPAPPATPEAAPAPVAKKAPAKAASKKAAAKKATPRLVPLKPELATAGA